MNWLPRISEKNLSKVSESPTSMLKIGGGIGLIYFLGMAIQSLRIIIEYAGVEHEKWRVVFASISLALYVLILLAPFYAWLYVKRWRKAQKKAH